MRTPWFLIALVGCGFPGSTGFDPDAAMNGAPDAMWPSGVDFLPATEEAFVDVDWTIDADTLIDTTTLIPNRLLPSGVTLLLGVQDGGAGIAILRVGSLKVNAGRTLSVRGTRPFAVLASKDITLDGAIDVGAQGATAGPSGGSGGVGLGAGGIATHDTGSGYDDAGAGGGGFGTMGGAGGKAGALTGGAGGATYPIGNQLVGGGSGGLAAACVNRPGGGGGALLLYAKETIQLNASASINAGGGGGEGGVMACGANGSGPGAGGGAGGAIWLHAKEIEGDGLLAANGGGGGGASYINVSNGGPGGDGKPSVTEVAMGGTKADSVEATAGGNGAIQGTGPSMIPDLLRGNGGGGGGGLGRIVVHTQKLSATLKSSPTAVATP